MQVCNQCQSTPSFGHLIKFGPFKPLDLTAKPAFLVESKFIESVKPLGNEGDCFKLIMKSGDCHYVYKNEKEISNRGLLDRIMDAITKPPEWNDGVVIFDKIV